MCYLGSLATDISQVISGDAGPKGALTYVLAAITLLVMLGSATWATLFVRYPAMVPAAGAFLHAPLYCFTTFYVDSDLLKGQCHRFRLLV